MRLLLRVFARTVVVFVDALQLLMLVRAVLSWFPPSDGKGGPVRNFIYVVTETFIAPVRSFLDRYDWARRSPLDISFLVTYLLLSLISTFFSIL